MYTVLYKTLHEPYAKLTPSLRHNELRFIEYSYPMLQNLHETYASLTPNLHAKSIKT